MGSCAHRPAAVDAESPQGPHSRLNLRAYAQAIQRYRDAGTLRYVRLLDGGITDNYGLHGISLRGPRRRHHMVRSPPNVPLKFDASCFRSLMRAVVRRETGRRI